MSEPRTPTGKRLVRPYYNGGQAVATIDVLAIEAEARKVQPFAHGHFAAGKFYRCDTPPCPAGRTTYPVELGGSMGGSLPTQPVAGVKARVNPGRPITAGPAVCQGCRSLVWWSGALWVDADGTWHRYGGRCVE